MKINLLTFGLIFSVIAQTSFAQSHPNKCPSGNSIKSHISEMIVSECGSLSRSTWCGELPISNYNTNSAWTVKLVWVYANNEKEARTQLIDATKSILPISGPTPNWPTPGQTVCVYRAGTVTVTASKS